MEKLGGHRLVQIHTNKPLERVESHWSRRPDKNDRSCGAIKRTSRYCCKTNHQELLSISVKGREKMGGYGLDETNKPGSSVLRSEIKHLASAKSTQEVGKNARLWLAFLPTLLSFSHRLLRALFLNGAHLVFSYGSKLRSQRSWGFPHRVNTKPKKKFGRILHSFPRVEKRREIAARFQSLLW